MTNEKELREGFRESKLAMFGNETQIADWWLSKFHSHTKEVKEKIKKLIEENRYTEKWSDDYYQAFDDLLASLEDNKK